MQKLSSKGNSKSFNQIGTETGLNNRKGLINGNGLTNGLVLTNDKGLTNGNGLSNGNGLTNGNVLTKGNENGNGNINIKNIRINFVKFKNNKNKILMIILAAFLIIAPLSIYSVDLLGTPSHIVIDGDFKDWKGVFRHKDSVDDMSGRPNINIIESGIVVENNRIFIMLEVSGSLFDGGDVNGADQVYILIDSDTNDETGYHLKGLGADYMIHAFGVNGRIYESGVYLYDQSYNSNGKWNKNDWNAWNLMNKAMIDIDRNKLEVCVNLYSSNLNTDRSINFNIFTFDYAGFSDTTDIISNVPGYLTVEQEPIIEEEIIKSASNVDLIKITATAHERPVTIDSISFKQSDNVDFTTSVQLPITLQEGCSEEIFVNVDTRSIEAESAIEIGVDRVSAKIKRIDTSKLAPVTISGNGYKGYIGSAPEKIVIDGAFGDWEHVRGHSDDLVESTLSPNINIDIEEYRTVEASDSLSLYLRVDGTMMKGTEILSGPIKVINAPILSRTNSNTPNSKKPMKSELYGYDYIYIYLDIDRNENTGYKPYETLGADFMIRIVGQSREIISRELFKFNVLKTDKNDIWIRTCEVPAANDAKRLETKVPFDLISSYFSQSSLNYLNSPNANQQIKINYFIQMTDWSLNHDFVIDPTIGSLGSEGTVSVINMNNNPVLIELKESNSQIPTATRTSSRGTLPNGDQNNANLSPADGTVIDGTYYNINSFEVKAGRIIYLKTDTSFEHESIDKIIAKHIWINGTISGIGRGSTGGWGGGATMEGEGGEGPSFHVGGGRIGFGPNQIGPSHNGGGGGGGGAGYGGTGGTGGNGGGPNCGGGGSGGSKYGGATTESIKLGSGGGGGGGGQHTGGGNGGYGGGAIWLRGIENLSISGVITVNGSSGCDGIGGSGGMSTGGGGGGGSGGGILINLDSQINALKITGKLYSHGGNGGNGGDTSGIDSDSGGGGGGGGGGRIKIFYNSSFINSSTIGLNAGSGGFAGLAGNHTGSSGTYGGGGTLYVIPEYRMIAIPVTLTIIVIFGLQRRFNKNTRNIEKTSAKEVM